MKLIKTETKQRALDGQWMLLGKILDYDNLYEYTNEFGKQTQIIPTMWIILDVASEEQDLKRGRFGKY
jgi:hypothetical protein